MNHTLKRNRTQTISVSTPPPPQPKEAPVPSYSITSCRAQALAGNAPLIPAAAPTSSIAYQYVGSPEATSLAPITTFPRATIEGVLDHRIVRADDDFTVLFGDFGYVVWSFDPTVKLSGGSGQAEKLQRAVEENEGI